MISSSCDRPNVLRFFSSLSRYEALFVIAVTCSSHFTVISFINGPYTKYTRLLKIICQNKATKMKALTRKELHKSKKIIENLSCDFVQPFLSYASQDLTATTKK